MRTDPRERKSTTTGTPTGAQVEATFEVKAVGDNASRTFEGLASTWERDLGDDVIHAGAFARTLSHWRASKGRIVPLVDMHRYHSVRSVLGKLVDAEETAEGLRVKFEVVPGEDGNALLDRLRGGFINGLSIGYSVVTADYEETTDEGGRKRLVRHIRELKLVEVSAVIWGMNPGALVDTDSVKSLFAAVRDGTLSAEQKAELSALLSGGDAPKPVVSPAGLAPDDPKRLRLESLLRDATVRSLATA
jgi:HK97 family phage prohead protease